MQQVLECVIPDGVLIQVGPPDDEHLLLETCRGVEIGTLRNGASTLRCDIPVVFKRIRLIYLSVKNTTKIKFLYGASSWSLTGVASRCTFNKI